MKYYKLWYTVSESIKPDDWLCAYNATSEFYEYASKLKGAHDVELAFVDAVNLVRYSTKWPSESLRKSSFKTLLEDTETILNLFTNAKTQLDSVVRWKNYLLKIRQWR